MAVTVRHWKFLFHTRTSKVRTYVFFVGFTFFLVGFMFFDVGHCLLWPVTRQRRLAARWWAALRSGHGYPIFAASYALQLSMDAYLPDLTYWLRYSLTSDAIQPPRCSPSILLYLFATTPNSPPVSTNNLLCYEFPFRKVLIRSSGRSIALFGTKRALSGYHTFKTPFFCPLTRRLP